MLFNIFSVLEKIGLNAQKRAIHVQFSNELLNHQVFLQRIEGQHQLNGGLMAELICLSTNAQIALKQFIGVQVAVDQVTDSGQLFRTTGIVTEASYGQSDGALTLYKLTIEDATNLWHKRRNSRVFMNKSIVEITEVLFKEWQEKSPLFAASLSLDLGGLSQNYDIRPFTMQHNESDYDFLTRLWRSEWISWLIDESELFVPHFTAPIQAQKLKLIDDNNQYQALARRSIRYHRSSATEYQDSITGFVAVRSLQPTAVHVQRWQPDALAQEEGNGSVVTTHTHSDKFDSATLSLEQAWHVSPAWMQDLKGEDQATTSSSSQLEKLNQHFTDMHASRAKYFKAYSSVRDTQVGYWFNLREHPEIDQHEGADQEFLIIAKNFYNQNNLPKDLHQQVSQLLTQSRWDQHGYDDIERQGNELTLIRRQIKTAPEYNPEQHRPIAYPQRAKVVGPEGETIHVDEWGRIKVRFLFTRSDDHGHDGGAGSNDNDTDSAWVDVLTPWAGEGYGARFLPRIGEVVVIDFFDGNIDRPFVTGRIHEAQRSPTKFDVKGQLPATKKLSGIRSQEINGSGFNQLRFDDTTGQISTQLQSSHAATQLNLGNLSHPKEKETSQGRGEGFELRTDAWGAVRAGKGLYISTQKQDQAQGFHLNANETKQQLEGGLNNSKALSEVAKNQQTDPLEVLDHLKTFLDQIEQRDKDKAAAFKQAIMVLSAPNSMALTSNENIHVSADGQISQTADDSISLSTQKNFIAHAQNKISFFAAQDGARMYAGKGKIELQAQSDGTDIFARKGVQIISTEDRIEITSPKEIILTADGSQLKINSSGIFPVTGGKLEVKAGQHLFMSGANIVVPKISLPTIKTPFSNKINYNWNINSEGKKELFIINKKNNILIRSHKNELDKNNNLSSLRFYTPEEVDFTAMIFNSDYIQLKQNIPDSENIDELFEETLLYDEENDDVYTEEEF
ncbi:type VI secretion system tip protein VgrG [Acinetobacter baumannii]|uniref:type VI secretion system Vgr family protein n=1 Tax=Acinetobacter baumannii TaxID=470 RepID=UPI001057A17A|nr:type VI secretion system Vgr family protein [Acinetobacter baumannii]MDC4852158.1 type VI secretion system tip protein VgrG [Acinetobacter baumannii]MDC4920181.1 type VI secretion system tip protein VgrG [Acinetobacter baumannii]MDC4956685.1 type VI secretion system tip protein VgrG [Acinetobacter baumannii]MDC4992908.1 type VI secretion system tip protein VgrG [Acinetobacter baumannii]MDN8225266.1 type VI secretion system Vgr family protein [Acinetobacter baumannii]